MENQREKIVKLIDEFSKDPDIKKAVSDIKERPMTTQNHYGDYLGFLTQFSKNKVMLTIVSSAMIKAGADAKGIYWANRLIGGD